jgi:hypothetical protein
VKQSEYDAMNKERRARFARRNDDEKPTRRPTLEQLQREIPCRLHREIHCPWCRMEVVQALAGCGKRINAT